MNTNYNDNQIILEFLQRGNSTRVCAVDARTGVEAAVVCPSNLPREQMEKVAIQKLQYVIKKHKAAQNQDDNLF